MATINATITSQDPIIKAGYNSYILVNSADNSIEIGARLGDGEGRHCDEIPYDVASNSSSSSSTSSSASANTPLLTGGPKCSDLIYAINGMTPDAARNITIQGTRGITIVTYPSLNLIQIFFYIDSKLLCGD
jgi:hypothetical protein